MEISHILITLLILHISSHLPSAAASLSSSSTKYQIECTMCSGCNNPCGKSYSPPPPPQSSSGVPYYYTPPQQHQWPPSQSQPTYYYPPPPKYDSYFPGPPPPDPIVPYFPYFYHSLPLPNNSGSVLVRLESSTLLAAIASSLLIFLSFL
ncbi:hypothetical protein SAY86_028609 [Trapa natans]|uniref:Uncharacterized protein n=1 Tax=Trapa natans TaxID=22666 RepID=A0AAN7MIS4_TRANT|nr:hypothetical protein SAY86_028609 [Trapa natans]